MNFTSTPSPHHHHHHHEDATTAAPDMTSFKLRPRISRTSVLLFETMDNDNGKQKDGVVWWNRNNNNSNRICHIIPVCDDDDDDDLLLPLLVDDNIDASISNDDDSCSVVSSTAQAQQPLALRPRRTTFGDHDDGVAADGELRCSLFHCYHPRTEPSFHLIRRSETSAFATPPVRQMNAALRQ